MDPWKIPSKDLQRLSLLLAFSAHISNVTNPHDKQGYLSTTSDFKKRKQKLYLVCSIFKKAHSLQY